MKLTELHSLTMQIKTDLMAFKDSYEEVLAKLSDELKMPMTIKPVQVILDCIGGNCTMYVLRDPKCPQYKMNDYIFNLAQKLKLTYDLSSVILKRKSMYIDENNVPTTIAVDPKEAAEIIKKATEDEYFSDKYKDAIRRKSQKELDAAEDAAADAKACAYAEKLANSIKNKLNTTTTAPVPSLEDCINDKPSEEAAVEISEIVFTIEANGQLLMLF